MRWMLALLVALPMLAGCLSDDDASTVQDTETRPGDDPATWSFDGLGVADATPVGPDAAPGSPWFTYTGFTGAEPNMGITSSGAIFVTAFEDTIKSTDGGMTWESVHDYRMVQGQSNIGTSDPMMWVDTDTDRVYVNHMWGLNCFNMLWSDDEGASWTQRDAACPIPVVDHQKIATGRPGPDPNPFTAAMPVYQNVLYTCYNKLVATDCFMSYDGGLTYPHEANVFNGMQAPCSGASGHPAIAPDGTIALAHGWNCGPIIGVSTDSGLTWTVHDGPEGLGAGASIDPDLAFTHDGQMFLTWRTADHYTYLARSPDLGATWDGVWNVTAPGLTSTRFHVASAGDGDRLGLAYLGTDRARSDGWNGAPIDAPEDTLWHLYVVAVENATGTPAFTSMQVTPDEDPVQKGCSWEGGGGGGDRSCRNMLDFIDSAVHPDGTFYVTYTEGCTFREGPGDAKGQCAMDAAGADEMDSRDREVAVAALAGWSLHE